MNEVTFALPPPIRWAMSPYTLVEATTGTVVRPGSAAVPADDPQPVRASADTASAAPAPAARARSAEDMQTP